MKNNLNSHFENRESYNIKIFIQGIFVKKTPLHFLSPGLNILLVRLFCPPTPAKLHCYHIPIIHPSNPPTHTDMPFCRHDWFAWVCKDKEAMLPCLWVPIRKRGWLIPKAIVDNKINVLNALRRHHSGLRHHWYCKTHNRAMLKLIRKQTPQMGMAGTEWRILYWKILMIKFFQ